MASPFQKSERSSSSRQSTPLRNHPNGDQRVNGYNRPHRDSFDDSPSRQLLEDFGRMLVNDERAFKRSLDEQTAVQQRKHMVALDDALAKHKAVRERAERTRERVELELERERCRREEEEKKAVEKARRDVEEQKLQEQRRQLEDAKVREEERKKQEALNQEQEELKQSVEAQKQREAEHSRRQSEVRKQQEAEQARRSAQEEAQRAESTRQQAENNQRQQQSTPQQPSASTTQQNGLSSVPRSAAHAAPMPAASSQAQANLSNLPKGIVTSTEEREAVHKQYLELHQRLKQMRAQVSEEVKKVQGLKDQLSDWRRAIKKCVGQLMKGSSDEIKRKNRRSTEEIVQYLDAASRVAEPSIDVTQYLVQNHQPPGASTQGPAVLVFLLNHFAKSIVNQFALEGAFESKIADVIGVLAVTVFARPQYLFNGQSLIDLLWAKLHQRCPVLFGISGPERTQAGRMKLGWAMEGGAFVTPDEHYTRMTGLGAGFAALTLRDFSRSKNSNPAPNRTYWESMARILNTPASEVSATHCVVLKAMIVNFVPRIIGMFGGAGVAVLRQALIVFPEEKGPQDEKGKKLPSVTALQSMPVLLQRDLHLTL